LKYNKSLADMKQIWDKTSKNTKDREDLLFLAGYVGNQLGYMVLDLRTKKPLKWEKIKRNVQQELFESYFGKTEAKKQKIINEYRKEHEALVKEYKLDIYNFDKYADGGTTDNNHLIAKAIEYIIGTAIDKDSIEIKPTEISYKRKNINVRRNCSE
jgi:hypothetical protein